MGIPGIYWQPPDDRFMILQNRVTLTSFLFYERAVFDMKHATLVLDRLSLIQPARSYRDSRPPRAQLAGDQFLGQRHILNPDSILGH